LHIPNLYKDQRILAFKEVYVLEKVHGTSAHVRWNNGQLSFFAGGVSHEHFVALFDADDLAKRLARHSDITVYGEAYGGKMQGMRDTYGGDLRFVVFDVKISDHWLEVPNMDEVARGLGFDVVPWTKEPCFVERLDWWRDQPSEIAARCGCGTDKLREGIVIRPPFEVTLNSGDRLIAKHKGEAFSERVHTPKVRPDKLEVESAASKIADEWITEMRLSHVLDKLHPPATELRDIPRVNDAMLEDVYREAKGEIVESKETANAIRRRAAQLFKGRITKLPT
jgi:hypothetical protein